MKLSLEEVTVFDFSRHIKLNIAYKKFERRIFICRFNIYVFPFELLVLSFVTSFFLRISPLRSHLQESQRTFNRCELYSFLRSRRIQELIRDAKGRLNDVSGMNIDVLWDESCASEPCPYYQQCRQVHKYLHSAQV